MHYFSRKMNRSDFQQLTKICLWEAKLLLKANAPHGAYYLAVRQSEFGRRWKIVVQWTERVDIAVIPRRRPWT